MNIEELISRFEYYAINHPAILHDPNGDRFQNAFLHLDIEDLQLKIKDGLKFQSLLMQTPGVEKNGGYDNVSEGFGFTYVVLNHDPAKSKAQLISEAKLTSDSIYSRLCFDIQTEGPIYGVIEGTDEGMFGPVNGDIYGWAVSLVISSGFDAELKNEDWMDLREDQS